ncbi:hypothetical protein [Pontibacter sp. HSC-14F20]|nr:hypothetical protein [Pontibacter sp. HSC-14F20]
MKKGNLYLTPITIKAILLAASAFAIYSFGKSMGEAIYYITT